jgi:hypothetical protein
MPEKDPSINEPDPSYGKRLQIARSLHDQEEQNYAYWSGLSGIERLSLATSLIEKLYGSRPSELPLRIDFD